MNNEYECGTLSSPQTLVSESIVERSLAPTGAGVSCEMPNTSTCTVKRTPFQHRIQVNLELQSGGMKFFPFV